MVLWRHTIQTEYKRRNEGIQIHFAFDKKLPLNFDTIFYQRKGFHEIIYYFKDGVYSEAEVSDELVNQIDNEIIGISKMKTHLGPKRVKELDANFPKK